jgi:tRNA dimethylallyltransferase
MNAPSACRRMGFLNETMAFAKNKTVIIVAGPTAAGKTPVAIRLAKEFETEIISADSRQCFKELNIGVARPSEEELQMVRHYFIASHSIHDTVNAGSFVQYALQKVNEIFRAHDVAIMVGGTGLYIKAFCEGMDEMPNVPEETRQSIILNYQKNGLEWLQRETQKKDPVFYDTGEIQNPRRLMRALEVAEATGRSILEFRKGKKEQRNFNIVKIGLELPKEELHRNINSRTERMIEAGLVEEVKGLIPYKNFNALQTVGYAEIFDHIEGKTPLRDAIELIKKNTRQYAKRQMTWFKKDKDIRWNDPRAIDLSLLSKL